MKNIIAAYAGTGKTYFASLYPELTIDLVSMPYKYVIDKNNTADFIDIFFGGWDRFMDSFENDSYGQHIVLQSNQFLSDVIDVPKS